MRLSGLRLGDLEVFVEVARTLNYTRAADALYYSEPRVYQRLKALERALGVRLVSRAGRGIELTTAGSALLAQAQAVLDQALGLASLADAHRKRADGSVIVGAASHAGVYILPALIARFRESDPDTDIRLELFNYENNAPDILRRLLDGTLDIGFVGELAPTVQGRVSPRLKVTPWQEIAMRLVIGSPYLERALATMSLERRVTLVTFAGSRHAPSVVRAWSDHGIEVKLIEFPNFEAVRQGALAGLGVALLAGSIADRDLEAGSLRAFPGPEVPLSFTLYLATRAEATVPARQVVSFFEGASAVTAGAASGPK